MNEEQQKKIAVLYHAECPDGFTGAWAARKKLEDSALYIGVYHNKPFPEEIRGKIVYLIDFNYPLDVMKEMKKVVAKIIVIDHHVSNKESLEIADDSLFDNDHSGAVLSWKYFHGNTPVPRFLMHVEDKDLWKFTLPGTREIAQALQLYDFDFAVWDSMVTDCESDTGMEKYLAEGKTLLRLLERRVTQAVATAEEIDFEGYRCLVANSSILASHIGNALTRKMSPIGIVWSRRGKRIIVSLRGDGSVDVSELAKKYGGGGHKNAAGFSWDEEDFIKFRRVKE